MRFKNRLYTLMVVGIVLIGSWFLYQKQQQYPINTITSYSQAMDVLNSLDSNSLVIFDVDDTLIMSSDALANKFPWWFRVLSVLKFPGLLFSTHWEDAWSCMWQQALRFLIEPSIVPIIRSLQQRGIKTVALTSMESGGYGCIPSMPHWRYEMLKGMGIEFNSKFKNAEFKSLPKYRGTYPVLFNGILCANQQDKGVVLDAFLSHAQFKPDKIVSFDDSVDDLQAIGKVCHARSIPCILFEYQGIQQVSTQWDTPRALKQIELLVKERKWMSDIQYAK
jgi:hypothetical protein